jgi:transketolase N-terminal domain/subunit
LPHAKILKNFKIDYLILHLYQNQVQIDGTKQEVMAIRHEKRLRTKVEKWKAESLEAVEGHDEGVMYLLKTF